MSKWRRRRDVVSGADQGHDDACNLSWAWPGGARELTFPRATPRKGRGVADPCPANSLEESLVMGPWDEHKIIITVNVTVTINITITITITITIICP